MEKQTDVDLKAELGPLEFLSLNLAYLPKVLLGRYAPGPGPAASPPSSSIASCRTEDKPNGAFFLPLRVPPVVISSRFPWIAGLYPKEGRRELVTEWCGSYRPGSLPSSPSAYDVATGVMLKGSGAGFRVPPVGLAARLDGLLEGMVGLFPAEAGRDESLG